jgi:hypothetical protein
MNIPQGFLELGIAAIIGFVFKVVFGLITKNEQKSDEADLRIEAEIKQLRREMREMDDRYRTNDRELYKQCSDIYSELSGLRAQMECLKGAKT